MAAKKNESNWIRTFEVTQPVRHVKGFTVYKVTSRVFLRTLPEGITTLTVWKRYNDFKRLYTQLEMIHRQLYLHGKVPTFPKGRVFGRFEYEVVEERRKAALKLLQFAATHPQLFTSKVFNKFFEEGYNSSDLIWSGTGDATDVHDSSLLEAQQPRQPLYSNTCLVPEKLWSKPPPCTNGSDVDGLSISSDESESVEATAATTDSDSIMSGSIFSSVSEVAAKMSTGSPKRASIPQCQSAYTLTEANLTLLDMPLESNETVIQTSSTNCDMIHSKLAPVLPTSSSLSSINASQSEVNLTSELVADQNRLPTHSCSNLSSTSISSNLAKKKSKSNMLGFFDFLPTLSKKDPVTARRASEDKLLSDSLTASYICEAAGHFAVAKQYESNELYSEAFSSYKEGIRILLIGAKNDSDLKRKALVRNKLDKYLSRAEALNREVQNPHRSPSPGKSFSSSFLLNNEVQRGPISSPDYLPRSSPLDMSLKTTMKPSPVEELKNYKIVRIIQTKVYTVVDMTEENPRCYAMKILNVSTCPVEPDKSTIIPLNVPFMVKLLKWFPTEDSYILLMQYAGGGRLKDFVDSYQRKPIVITPVEPSQSEYDGEENENSVKFTNCDSTESSKILSVLTALSELNQNCEDEKENCESYTRLFREYSVSTKRSPADLAKDRSEPVPVPFSGSMEEEFGNQGSPLRQRQDTEINSLPDKVPNVTICTTSVVQPETREISWSRLHEVNTQDLIESSRALIQTVNQTLENVTLSDNESLTLSSTQNQSVRPCSSQDGKSEKVRHETSETNNFSWNSDNKLVISEKRDKSIGSVTRRMSGLSVPSPTFSSGDFLSRSMEALNTDDCNPQVGSCFRSGEETPGTEICNQRSKVQDATKDSCSNFTPDSVEQSNIQRLVPECCLKVWAAEMVMCLENLHRLGLAYGDLEMKNVLLRESGHILLSFTSQWSQVDQNLFPAKNSYSAPELCHSLGQPMWKIHPSCDFWSFGAILFELLIGQTVQSAHPEGFHPQTLIRIPGTNILGESISAEAKSLLAELLQFSPSLRLGYYGADEIKNHPFFEGLDWERAQAAGLSPNTSTTT